MRSWIAHAHRAKCGTTREGSELCAADGWVDKGWKHVTSTILKLSGVSFHAASDD